MALKLLGLSAIDIFNKSGNRNSEENQEKFHKIIERATGLLDGSREIPGMDNDQILQTLMGSWSHILIDEYQDIDQAQYDFVSAIAGRLRNNPDTKLAILAVGDDDQNIYQFRKTNTKFIRQFEDDYQAERHHLVENYRSTSNIINAANHLIRNRDRMKINSNSNKQISETNLREELGGSDPVSHGQVQILSARSIDPSPPHFREPENKKASGSEFCLVGYCYTRTEKIQLNPVRAVLENAGAPINGIQEIRIFLW